ncbi:MAG TPA: hypothetical protein VK636_08425 [Gemmatimonadaceae bacterium]|nr:hypothetical protein [Gemmatimonadaceae bacterium]
MPHFTDPLALFRAAVDALNAEDWAAAAALVDPVSVRVFARQLLERLAPGVPQRTVTADEYLLSDPQLPRAVAEHYAAEAVRHADPTLRLPLEFPDVTSVEGLRALTPVEILARWLDGRSLRRQTERLAAHGRISLRALEVLTLAGFAGSYQYVALGMVADGDAIAHVLYHTHVAKDQPWSGDAANWLASLPPDEQVLAREMWTRGHPTVATVRRQIDGTWRLLIEHDFLGIGGMHISGIRMKDEETPTETDAPDGNI